MDLAAWLHSLGMQQYEAAFRDNAIDGAVLPQLTADDLKDLGVNLVGHRRRLLDAIAALGAVWWLAPLERRTQRRERGALRRVAFPFPTRRLAIPLDCQRSRDR